MLAEIMPIVSFLFFAHGVTSESLKSKMFKLSEGGPRQRGHFPPKYNSFLKIFPCFAISGKRPGRVRKNFDGLSQDLLIFDRGYWDKPSKKKQGAGSHPAARALTAGNRIWFGGEPLVQNLSKGTANHVHPP